MKTALLFLAATSLFGQVQVGTPLSDSGNGLDPRRVGVRTLGAYWGAAGEQIDTSSGNVNFSLPLLKPLARGSWSMSVVLSYNSQMWRRDSAGTLLLGYDVGYGLGWKLQVASLLPVWAGSQPDHFLFIDSSGAEYSLAIHDVVHDVWSSREGIHVWYDRTNNQVHMPDGSAWTMGCTSSAAEQDAGTLYPTQVEDSNGNQIAIIYKPGIGSGSNNTSARIMQINDSRYSSNQSYSFSYNSDPIPHLQSITSYIATAENYAFNYASNQTVTSPFGGGPSASTTLLQSVTTTGLNVTSSFGYNSSGEITSYTSPLGGTLGWAYRNFTYTGSVTVREVQSRTMNSGAGLTNSWSFGHDPSEESTPPTVHSYVQVTDNGTNTSKVWWSGVFNTTLVVPSTYEERNVGYTPIIHKGYAWNTDSAGNAYTCEVYTSLDLLQAYHADTITTQVMDIYGNVTQMQVYDYGNLSSPARTYTYTYLYQQNSNYVGLYIYNRLYTATVVSSTGTVPLFSALYDQSALQTVSGYYLHDVAYDATKIYRGNPTSTTNLGTTMTYLYQTTGVMYQATDGAGTVTSITPSAATNYSLPGALTPNSNSNLTTSVTYSSSFAVTSVTGPNGATGSTIYDNYGRPTSNTSPDGAVTNYTYTYVPAAAGNTQTATITTGTSTQWKTTTLDGFGRVIKVQTGHDSTAVSEVDTQYAPCACSPLGKLWRTSVPFAAGGSPSGWTTYGYDGSGRTVTVAKPGGVGTTTYVYQGNTTTITDPALAWKTFTNDANGNLITVTEPDPKNMPSGTLVTNYIYNSANQLITVSMPRGTAKQTRSFAWTGSDLTSTTNPENGIVGYQYDGAHHVTQRTDANGQKTKYTYDSYGRLTLVQHYNTSNTELPGQDVNYYYDYPQFSGAQNTWGRLSAVTFNGYVVNGNNPMAYLYSYNQAGRVTTQQLSMLEFPYTLQAAYAWDNQGRMTSQTYPDGSTTYNNQYDAMGNLSGMTTGYSTVASASYTFAGQLSNLIYYYGTAPVFENRTYDSQLRLSTIQTTAPGLATLVNMQYIYPASADNGRISRTVDSVSGETVNYTYDQLNRLATATAGSWSQTYTYDNFGNLTGTNGAAVWSFDPATNHPTGTGTTDNNGNSLANSNVWDVENRLVSTLNANGYQTMTYQYDPWGKRISQSVGSFASSKTIYFYSITGQRLQTFLCTADDGNGNPRCLLQQSNVYFGRKLILNGAGTSPVATDRLGSIRYTSAGNISYYPYGQERPQSNGQTTPDNTDKFATYFRDWIGQDYADQRYYSSNTGSFWTPDPLGASAADPTDPNSWNMYAYAGGDPINFNDPDGTTACGDLQILGTGSSLSSAVTGGGDTALLADLVWAESDHTWSRQASQAYYNEQDAVAWTVENRWKILNGYLSVAGVSNPSTLGWGPNGASISQIIGWSSPTQFSTISGGQLRSDLQSTLNSVLAGSPTAGDVLNLNLGNLGVVSMTHECFDVWQSYVAASFALNGTSSDPFASQGYTTSFHHGTNTTSLEGYFGNFGDANNFFGIAKGSVTVNPTPVLPRPRPRPIRPPGRGGRRGPL